jgi:polar amino acid transport system substrate-binding protein
MRMVQSIVRSQAFRLRRCLVLALAFTLAHDLTSAAYAATFTGCAEFGNPQAPTQIASGDPSQTALGGFTAEFSRALFARIGHSIEFRDLPFARCMRLVADGEIDFALGPYQDVERARIYSFSKPYRVMTPQVFQRTDSPLRISTVADLKLHLGCGMNGSSYAHYGLKPGDLDQGATSYAGLILKLKAGRCDYFVEELQVIHNTENGRYLNDRKLRHNEVAGAIAPGRHLATAKGGRGEALLPVINEKIEELRQRGEIVKLWKQTEGDRPF